MTITTLAGHVARAIEFYKKDNKYFGLGGLAEWEDPNNPPKPKPTDSISDFIGFKRVESCQFVVKADKDAIGNLVEYKGQKWRIVPPEDAFIEGAHWVYLNSYVNYEELPVNVSYRQVGLYTDVVLDDEVNPESYAYTPDLIQDVGILNVLDNRGAISRSSDMKEQISMIIEF